MSSLSFLKLIEVNRRPKLKVITEAILCISQKITRKLNFKIEQKLSHLIILIWHYKQVNSTVQRLTFYYMGGTHSTLFSRKIAIIFKIFTWLKLFFLFIFFPNILQHSSIVKCLKLYYYFFFPSIIFYCKFTECVV